MKHWPFKVINADGGKPKVQVEYKGETKTFTPEEISSMVLGKMKETAEAFLGHSVKACLSLVFYLQLSKSEANSKLMLHSIYILNLRFIVFSCPSCG